MSMQRSPKVLMYMDNKTLNLTTNVLGSSSNPILYSLIKRNECSGTGRMTVRGLDEIKVLDNYFHDVTAVEALDIVGGVSYCEILNNQFKDCTLSGNLIDGTGVGNAPNRLVCMQNNTINTAINTVATNASADNHVKNNSWQAFSY